MKPKPIILILLLLMLPLAYGTKGVEECKTNPLDFKNCIAIYKTTEEHDRYLSLTSLIGIATDYEDRYGGIVKIGDRWINLYWLELVEVSPKIANRVSMSINGKRVVFDTNESWIRWNKVEDLTPHFNPKEGCLFKGISERGLKQWDCRKVPARWVIDDFNIYNGSFNNISVCFHEPLRGER